ncbi:hypothetical protein HDU96_005141 [Phlyctochytrium bullatum]|nr:hypothetical protein HDU96_005141 [Phlyctochytrium bullatum]
MKTPVLTKLLQRDFVRLTEISDRNDRITELSRLVSQLPLTNYTLLRVIMAHLIRVVQASDVNKMTVRNVGIVFSPTLGIPVVVLTLMMAEYDLVFCWEDSQKAQLMRDREREMMERLSREREGSSAKPLTLESDAEKSERPQYHQMSQHPQHIHGHSSLPMSSYHESQSAGPPETLSSSPKQLGANNHGVRNSPPLVEKSLKSDDIYAQWRSNGEGPSVIIMHPPTDEQDGSYGDEQSRVLAAKKARREQARMSIAPGLLMARANGSRAGERKSNRNSFVLVDDSHNPSRDGNASLTDSTGASDEEGQMLDLYTSNSMSRGAGGSAKSESLLQQCTAGALDSEVIVDGEGEVYVDGPGSAYRFSEYYDYDDVGVKPSDGVFPKSEQGEAEYESELFG